MIRLAYNSKVHQVIDVIVVDIPEAYGLIFVEIGQPNLMVTLQPTGLTYGYHSKVNQTR